MRDKYKPIRLINTNCESILTHFYGEVALTTQRNISSLVGYKEIKEFSVTAMVHVMGLGDLVVPVIIYGGMIVVMMDK